MFNPTYALTRGSGFTYQIISWHLCPHKTITNNIWQGIKWYRNKYYFNGPFLYLLNDFVKYTIYCIFLQEFFLIFISKLQYKPKVLSGFFCVMYIVLLKKVFVPLLSSASAYTMLQEKRPEKNLSAEKFRIIVNGSS